MEAETMKRSICIFFGLVLAVAATWAGEIAPGTLVVLNKSDATATLISLETGETVATLGTGIGPHEVAVSPDGRTAVVCNYGELDFSSLTVIDLGKKRPLRTIHLGEYRAPHGIEYLPDGERVLVTVERSRAVILVNIKTGRVDGAFDTGDLSCHMLATTPDGRLGFGADIRGGAVGVLDMEKGTQVKVIKTGAGAEGVGVTPDGQEAWVTNRAADTVSIIDIERLEIVKTIPCGNFPIRIKFTPDGGYALVSNAKSADIAVFDTKNKREVRRIAMKVRASEDLDGRLFERFGASPMPIGIVITPDGTQAFVANTNADIVTVIDLKTWTISRRLRAGKEPDGMAHSPLTLK
jgi:YVTN family beta-propeller protein